MKTHLENDASLMIKIAEVSDAALIKEIAYNTWYDAYGTILTEDQITFMLKELYEESVIRELIIANEQEFIIIFKKDFPVGFASYGALNKDVLKLYKIYVSPNVQGLGLGDKLMDAVKEKAIINGYKHIELNVNRSNKALSYYKKCGFQTITEVNIPIGPYWMNDYVMQCAF